MKTLSILSLWLASCILSLGAGALNGVAVTHWNGVAFTAWNGSGVSAAGGGGGGALEFASAYTGFTSNGWANEQGWEITPSTDIPVTHLAAMFTSGSYGNKTVTLRTSGGTVIETVTAVFSGATLNVWTWVVLTTPRVLTSGTKYLVTTSGGFNDGPWTGSLTYSTTHITPGVEVDATGTPTGTGASLPSYSLGINIRYTVP